MSDCTAIHMANLYYTIRQHKRAVFRASGGGQHRPGEMEIVLLSAKGVSEHLAILRQAQHGAFARAQALDILPLRHKWRGRIRRSGFVQRDGIAARNSRRLTDGIQRKTDMGRMQSVGGFDNQTVAARPHACCTCDFLQEFVGVIAGGHDLARVKQHKGSVVIGSDGLHSGIQGKTQFARILAAKYSLVGEPKSKFARAMALAE